MSGARRDSGARRARAARRDRGEPPADRRPQRLPGSGRRHGHEPGAHRAGDRRGARAAGCRDRAALAHEVTRAALMGARGNSGVILSQIVRGAAEVLGASRDDLAARAARSASDAAYRAVRSRSRGRCSPRSASWPRRPSSGRPTSPTIVARGDDGVVRTPEHAPRAARGRRRRRRRGRARRDPARDRGGPRRRAAAGSAPSGRSSVDDRRDPPGALALPLLHRLRRRGRGPRRRRARGASSTRSATRCSSSATRRAQGARAHRRPGAALSLGLARGVDRRASRSRTCTSRRSEREERLLARRSRRAEPPRDAVAVAAGARQPPLFESLGARGRRRRPDDEPLDGGAPRRHRGAAAPEAIVLPNNRNVLMPPSRRPSTRPSRCASCRRSRSRRAWRRWSPSTRRSTRTRTRRDAGGRRRGRDGRGHGRLARRRADGARGPQGRLARARRRASRSRAATPSTRSRARCVDRLLAEPRSVLTLLTGEDAAARSTACSRPCERGHPELELEVHEGGQPHYRSCSRPNRAYSAGAASSSSRTTQSSARRSSCCSACGETSTSSASVADGQAAVARRAPSSSPTSCSFDYRMPGLTAPQTTEAMLGASPATRVVCLTASVSDAEIEELYKAGAVACVVEGRGARRESWRRSTSLRTCRADGADRREHGDRPRLDRRFPRGAGRATRTGASCRSTSASARRASATTSTSPRRVLRAAAAGRELPTTSQPTPGRLPRGLRGARAALRARSSRSSLGRRSPARSRAPQAAAEMLGGDGARDRHRTVSAAIAMLALAVQRRLDAAPPTRRSTRSSSASSASTAALHGRHARLPRERRPDRPRAAFAGKLLNVKPILTIRDGEVVPLKRVRGTRRRSPSSASCSTRPRPTRRRSGRHRPRGGAGAAGRLGSSSRGRGRTRRSRWRRRSARSSGPTPGRAPSACSGSTTSSARSSPAAA